MRLVYIGTDREVKINDLVKLKDDVVRIINFREPHKPASIGKVTVRFVSRDQRDRMATMEYYVSVIGAEWIEREDRQ